MSSGVAGQKRAASTSPSNFDAPSSSKPSTLEDLLLNNDVLRDTLLPYLDPTDLIRLMHTSKSTRRIAAPLLNELETKSNQTMCHTEMFRRFLRSPRITEKNKVWEELTTDAARAKIAGPLRLYHIKEKASETEKRFAIMKYKKSYDKEDSFIVIFDEKGAYIGYYMFSSEQFYEDYASRDILSGGDHFGRGRVFNSGDTNTSMPKMTLLYTDDDVWTGPREAQTDYMWNEGWMGCFVGFICSNARPFSDTRVIYVMTISLFDNFDQDLQYNINDFDHDDDDDSVYQRAVELREKLSRVSYTLTDDELQSLCWAIVCNVLENITTSCGDSDTRCRLIRTQLTQDAICNSIPTHYGWSEVDTRRRELVSEYCKSLVDYVQQSQPNST